MSVMGAHSLLEDMYGNRAVPGTALMNSITTIGNGQIVRLLAQDITIGPFDVEPTIGFFSGRVLTFIDGPAAGRSTRIVGSDQFFPKVPGSNVGSMQINVLAVDGLPIAPISNPPEVHFIINGRAFSGTGFGFRLSSFVSGTSDTDMRGQLRLLDAMLDDSPAGVPHLYALLPNHSVMGFHPNLGPLNPYTDPAGPGGANEDCDVPDFQNMLMAVRLYAGGNMIVPLPSLHRPDLVNYWVKATSSGTWQNLAPEIQRGCILRPLAIDHPSFTGSNPNFKADYDPLDPNQAGKFFWDVDNDGDGVPDSIWVDLGMPVQTAPDGRVYKPMFAVLCVDLDGKLNLNAQGNLTQLDATRFGPISGPFALAAQAAMGPPPQQTVRRMRVGQGLGPPEISLHHLFQGNASEYKFLLTGSANGQMGALLPAGMSLDGRYGESQRTLPSGFLPGPGMSRLCDPLAWVMQADQPPLVNHLAFPHVASPYGPPINPSGYSGPLAACDYGTPPDLDADGMLALDLRGQPIYVGYTLGSGWGEVDERVDSPYELDLSLNARHAGFSSTERFGTSTGFQDGLTTGQVSSVDAPFTAAELERLLRFNDVDSTGLPNRLLLLARTAFNNPVMRNQVTYASYDPPVPSMVFTSPEAMKALSKLVGTSGKTPPMFDSNLTQLVAAKIKRDNPGYSPAQIDQLMQKVLPIARPLR